MTEFWLIRHGETDWNRELRFQGQIDVPLNAIGQEQARRLALRLAQEDLHALACSDLARARQTALAIGMHQSGAAQVLEAGLREQHFGDFEGLRAGDIALQYPQHWARWLEFDADFAPEGGESTRQFHQRVMASLHRLAQTYPQHRVAVVTHGGVLDMVYRSALSLPLSGPRQSEIPNAGLNRVRVHGGVVEILSWADTRHLEDLPLQPVYDQQALLDAHKI